MTVNRTTLLDLPLPVTGTESGTWGDTTNNGLTQYLDIAIAGTLVLSTDADVTLTSTEGDSSATNIGATTAQYAILRWTATGSTTRNITALAQSKTYVVINATGGTQSIVLRGAGPTTGVTIISGEKAHCVWNGSDFVKISSSAAAGGSNTQVQYNSSGVLAGSSNLTFDGTSLTLGGNPTLSAGTANGVLYLNGSKVATSGSALTFDGTTLGNTGNASFGEVSGSALTLKRVTSGNNIDLNFYNPISTAGVVAKIRTDGDGISNIYGALSFQTTQTPDTLVERYRITSTGVSVWSVAGSEQMRLTSTGLGIGTSSPSQKLEILTAASASTPAAIFRSAAGVGNTGGLAFYANDTNANARNWYLVANSNAFGDFVIKVGASQGANPTSGNTVATLDASGNLGLGVTPSAWNGAKGFESGLVGNYFIGSTGASYTSIGTAAYYNGTNWTYARSTGASKYELLNNTHAWFTAPSGTAGNLISFGDPKMTLDASGNLGIGTSSPSDSQSFGRALDMRGSTGSAYYSATSDNTTRGYFATYTGGAYVGSETNHPLIFRTNNTECARITSGGDLLVGTTSAVGKLTVAGAINSYNYVQNVAASTTQTIFTMAESQCYLVYVTEGASSTHSVAIASTAEAGTTAVLTSLYQSSGNTVLSASGLNIQITNNFGVTRTMKTTVTRIV